MLHNLLQTLMFVDDFFFFEAAQKAFLCFSLVNKMGSNNLFRIHHIMFIYLKIIFKDLFE